MTWKADEDIQTRREEMREKSRAEAQSIMLLAGFDVVRTWELANRYWPDAPTYDSVRRPWWLFETDIGLIQIGWRKRVINIDWEATSIRIVVTEDDVTKDDAHVHAWSVEKAITYLRALKAAATNTMAEGEG